MLTSVLKEIDKKDNKEQKSALEALKKANVIDKEQSPSLDLRLALLNKDTDFLKKNKKNIDSQELADRIVKYFSSEKEYQEAISLLKDFPNKDLEHQVKEADKSNQKKQLAAKLNDAKKAVSDTQKQLDGKNKQISDLHKQLDNINKGNDKDKGKHAQDKQKEIDNVNKEKNKISDTLKNQQRKEQDSQKQVDDVTNEN